MLAAHAAERRRGSRHSDLYEAFVCHEGPRSRRGKPPPCPSPAGGFLVCTRAVGEHRFLPSANHDLLDALRQLAFTSDGYALQAGRLPQISCAEDWVASMSPCWRCIRADVDAGTFELRRGGGSERKTTAATTPVEPHPVPARYRARPRCRRALKAAATRGPRARLPTSSLRPGLRSGPLPHRRRPPPGAPARACVPATKKPAPGHAPGLRDVIGHCVYGVDINPMSVELCKVNLWMEAPRARQARSRS